MIKPWLIFVFEVEYFALLIGFVTFTVSYHVLTRGDWRRTTAGRILMALGSSCSVILVLSVLRIFAPDEPWRVYATAAALAALVAVVAWLNGVLYSRQLGDRRRPRGGQIEREDQKL
jgi:hypothetical protein